MTWPSDILQILAMLLASAGIVAGSVVIAGRLGLDRLWRPRSRSEGVDRAIASLSLLADRASEGGLLSIESHAATMKLPCLNLGVDLLIKGVPAHELRARLLAELDAHPTGDRGRFAVTLPVLLACAGLIGLGISTVASFWLAANGQPEFTMLVLASLALPSGLVLAGVTRFLGHGSSAVAVRLLEGMLVIEALSMISAGRDGQAVRAHLHTTLPVPAPARAAAA